MLKFTFQSSLNHFTGIVVFDKAQLLRVMEKYKTRQLRGSGEDIGTAASVPLPGWALTWGGPSIPEEGSGEVLPGLCLWLAS